MSDSQRPLVARGCQTMTASQRHLQDRRGKKLLELGDAFVKMREE